MEFRVLLNTLMIMIICLSFSQPLWAQDSLAKTIPEKSPNKSTIFRLSDQDMILPVTSIEWGEPDRWSFTSRYVHSFEKERKRKIWHSNFTIFLSPGLSGGRLGTSFIGIYSPPSWHEMAFFSEFRVVLLRTWGNPLSTNTNTTFFGTELKLCLSWILNLSAGYYTPISQSREYVKSFWGFHFGIGI